MSTKHVDETCRQNSFRPNYVDKMSSTKYAVDEVSIDKMSVDEVSVDKTHCRQMICNSKYRCFIDYYCLPIFHL